jgi:O-antigen/teichoic acid export membrane protein
MSLTSILIMGSALRFEYAIPVVREDDEAIDLVGLGLVTVAFTTLLIVVGVWLLGPWLARVTDIPSLEALLWLLPTAVCFYGLSSPLNNWSIRRGTFRLNSFNKVLQASGQAAGQLGFGLAGAGVWGLIVGYTLGPFLMFAHLLGHLPETERKQLLSIRWSRLSTLVRRHWQYPVYSTPSSILTSATQLLPAVLLAVLYGPAVAGWFGLSQRVMGMPTKLLAQAASAVFLGEAPKLADDHALRRLFVRSTLGFAGIGLLGLLPILLFGPSLFAVMFGRAWESAGLMAALLVPQTLMRFVVTPVSQTLNIYGRQDLHLVAALANGLAMVIAFGLAWMTRMPPMQVIVVYSAGSALAYGFYLALAWMVARRGGLTPAPVPEAEPVAIDA